MRVDIIKRNKPNEHIKYIEMDFIPRKGDQITIQDIDTIYVVDIVNYWIVDDKLLSIRIWVNKS